MARINECALCLDWRTARDVPVPGCVPRRGAGIVLRGGGGRRRVPDRAGAAGRRVRPPLRHRPPAHGRRVLGPAATTPSPTTSWSTWPCASARGSPSAGSTRSSTSTAPAGCPPSTAPRPCRPEGTPWRRSSRWCGASGTASRATPCATSSWRTPCRGCTGRGPGPPPVNVHDSAAAAAPLAGPRAGGRGAPRGRGLDVARLLRAHRRDRRGPGRPQADDRLVPGGRVALRRLRHHPLRRAPRLARRRALARGADGGPHPPARGPRLPRVDHPVARHAVTGVGRAAAPDPVRAQRGGPVAHRRAPPGSTASSRRAGPRSSTWPIRSCSSTPRPTRS